MNWYIVENEIKYRQMESEKRRQRLNRGKGIDYQNPKNKPYLRRFVNLFTYPFCRYQQWSAKRGTNSSSLLWKVQAKTTTK
jgi:hypothetical protein